jgi:integrase
MGRKREPITLDRLTEKGNKYFCYLKHPLRHKVVCFSLGPANEVPRALEKLNQLYLNEEYWVNPPDDIPQRIREQWVGPDGVLRLHGDGKVETGRRQIESTSEEVAALTAENELLQRERIQHLRIIETQARELEVLRGKKYQKGLSPTLAVAAAKWLTFWKNSRRDRSPVYVQTVTWDIQKFVQRFGENTPLDELDGKEEVINKWLNGLQVPVLRDHEGTVLKWKPMSPSRLMQIRTYALKMLTESGCSLVRKNIVSPTQKELRESRGRIRWLTKGQAESIIEMLSEPFADAFRIQVAIGLRPGELLTLHASHFEEDFKILHLQPLGSLRLKTGGRTIPIPEFLRPTIKKRVKENDVLFPDPATMKAYSNPRNFTKLYKPALIAAAAAAKPRIHIPMDSRVGRRTCASLLIQANVSAEKVGALLGNSPLMILNHYGDPDTRNLDLTPTELSSNRK